MSDDPITPGNTGIAKPLDVLCLQEFNAPSQTLVPLTWLRGTPAE